MCAHTMLTSTVVPTVLVLVLSFSECVTSLGAMPVLTWGSYPVLPGQTVSEPDAVTNRIHTTKRISGRTHACSA